MLKSRKNRSCGGKVTRPWSSRPSIRGNHPHFRTFPRVKSFRQGFWVTRLSNFYAVRTVGKRRQRRTWMRTFNFFTRRTSFLSYLCSLVYRGRWKSKDRGGLLKNSCSCLPSPLRSFFYHIFLFFPQKIQARTLPYHETPIFNPFLTLTSTFDPSFSPFCYVHEFSPSLLLLRGTPFSPFWAQRSNPLSS